MVFGALSPNLCAKDRPSYGVSYEYPAKVTTLKNTATLALRVWDQARFDQIKVTFRVEAYKEVVTSSNSSNVSVSKSLAASAKSDEARWQAEIKVPITVNLDGEYLIHWSADLMLDEESIRTQTGTIAVLAEDGKVWFGADSIDLAYVECLKNQLGIRGNPQGSSLAKLNKRWARWLEDRQVKIRQP